jgi:hypothetical protein
VDDLVFGEHFGAKFKELIKVKTIFSPWRELQRTNQSEDDFIHLFAELLCLLGHVDDLVLGEHFGAMGLITTGSTQGLT